LFTKSRGVPFLEGSDRFSFSAALGATVVRIGNLFNSEIVGRKVPGQTWGIRFPRNIPDHGLDPVPLRYPSQIYEIALGMAVFVGLLIADRVMGKEKRPRGAMISWFFALYFTGRLFTEHYKEIEALPLDSAISMGQYLSILPALLGWYGVWRSLKRREPVGWVEGGAHADPEEEEADEEDEQEVPPVRVGKAKSKANAPVEPEDEEDDEGEEDDENEEDEDESPVPTKKSRNVDPDVEAEFEAGKLKKRREDPET
jgi:hypothetical protein